MKRRCIQLCISALLALPIAIIAHTLDATAQTFPRSGNEASTIRTIAAVKTNVRKKRLSVSIRVSPSTPTAPSRVRFQAVTNRKLPSGARIEWKFSDGRRVKGRTVRRLVTSVGRLSATARVIMKVRGKGNRTAATRTRRINVLPNNNTDPTPTPTPIAPIIDAHSCAPSLQIIDEFTHQDTSRLVELQDFTSLPGLGLSPTRNVVTHPLPESSTVIQLDFENNDPPGLDSSLGTLSATCDDCPTIVSNGRIGKAASFDGTKGLVTGAQLPRYAFTNKNLSWAMWFKSSSAATQSLFGSYCGYGHLQSKLQLSGGRLQFYVDPASAGAAEVFSSSSSLNNGQWHHVVAVRHADTGSMQLFVDGVLDAQTSGSALGGDVTCGKFAIGMSGISFPASNGFRGDLDGVALYDRALSSDEISHLFSTMRRTGEITSRRIILQQPAYSISALIDESNIGHTTVELSFDGTTWCEVNGELNDPRCSFPASQVWYRAKSQDRTTIASVQLDFGCSPRCIDYDNDGHSSIQMNTPFCANAGLDCNDQNAFQNPGMTSSTCSCSGSSPTVEICNDGIDNDCNGAIDDKDSQCYNAGSIYYVSSSVGSDSNTGRDPNAPIRTLSMVQSLLNSDIVPGDKILFRRGDTWTEGNLLIKTRGSTQQPLQISTYGFGPRAEFRYSTPITAINFDDAAHVLLDGIHVTRTDKTIGVFGVGFNPQRISSNITLRDIHLDGLAYGMMVYATNFVLEDSVLNDNENSQSGGGHSQGLWVYHGSDHGIVRNNIFRNNGKFGVIFDHNIYLGGGDSWLFEGNDFSGDSGTSIVFHGVQNGHIIRDNTFHDNTRAPAIDISDYTTGQYLQNFIVERNRIFNNPAGAFWIRGAVNLLVRNNLIYNNPSVFNIGSGFDHESTIEIDHNSLHNNGGSSFPVGGTYNFSGNLYSATTNLGGGISLSTSTFADPSAGDFRLLAGSAAIDTAPTSTIDDDFFGRIRPVDGDGNGSALPDYGAIEFGSSVMR